MASFFVGNVSVFISSVIRLILLLFNAILIKTQFRSGSSHTPKERYVLRCLLFLCIPITFLRNLSALLRAPPQKLVFILKSWERVGHAFSAAHLAHAIASLNPVWTFCYFEEPKQSFAVYLSTEFVFLLAVVFDEKAHWLDQIAMVAKTVIIDVPSFMTGIAQMDLLRAAVEFLPRHHQRSSRVQNLPHKYTITLGSFAIYGGLLLSILLGTYTANINFEGEAQMWMATTGISCVLAFLWQSDSTSSATDEQHVRAQIELENVNSGPPSPSSNTDTEILSNNDEDQHG
eukprot:jgi/Bigna1/88325/estExt_fgenesh1_pg.C_300159